MQSENIILLKFFTLYVKYRGQNNICLIFSRCNKAEYEATDSFTSVKLPYTASKIIFVRFLHAVYKTAAYSTQNSI